MMKIESYEQLRKAKVLSKQRIKMLEEEIKNDVREIKEDLNPAKLVGSTIRNMFSSEKHGLVTESLNVSVNALIKGLLFRNSNFITKTLVAFAAKNLANNLVMQNSDNILDWLQSNLKKLKNRNKHKHNGQYFDESTANVDLDN